MNDEKMLKVSEHAHSKYGLSGAPRQAMINYGRALLVIAGADGKVSPNEYQWLVDHQTRFGATEDILAEYKNFDYKSADLSSLLTNIKTDVSSWKPGPHLIYHAIQMCSADGHYAKQERTKIVQAARTLGVTDDVVLSLEALIKMEAAVYDMRAAIFHISVIE